MSTVLSRIATTCQSDSTSFLPSSSSSASLPAQFLLRFTTNVGSHSLRGVISTNFSGFSSRLTVMSSSRPSACLPSGLRCTRPPCREVGRATSVNLVLISNICLLLGVVPATRTRRRAGLGRCPARAPQRHTTTATLED